MSCYNRDKVGSRFRILSDVRAPLMNSAPTVTTQNIPFTGEIPLDFVTFYTANSGTITDLVKNNVFLLTISNGGVCDFYGNFQLCYKDL